MTTSRADTDVCPVCGSPPADRCWLSSRDRSQHAPGTFCVALCSACGGGWTLPTASEEELASFYAPSYPAYLLERGFLGRLQRLGQRLVLDYAFTRPPLRTLADMAPGAVLDVGCGRGDLAAALARRGWRAFGLDPSPQACALARARGVEVQVGTLGSTSYGEGSFDAVVMNHSLEHVPDPSAALARVHHLLQSGGFLLVSVPNFACWQRERFGSAWFPLELPRHRTHFTPGSLRLALSRAGFEVAAIETSSDFASYALLATLQNVLAGRVLLTSGLAVWAGYVIGVVASPVTTLVDRMKGGGPVLHGVAQRPAA